MGVARDVKQKMQKYYLICTYQILYNTSQYDKCAMKEFPHSTFREHENKVTLNYSFFLTKASSYSTDLPQ